MTILQQTIDGIAPLDQAALEAARRRQDQLTKPPGSLGRLEALSIQLAGITGRERPRIARPVIMTFAADHGIAGRGVSAYPQAVTAQMVLNFLSGGAAINALARQVGAEVIVADLGVAAELAPHPRLRSCPVAPGTRDFSQEPAMSAAQARRALETGVALALQAIQGGADCIGTGEMGIGNTSAASAITAALAGRPVAEVTGRGTGVDDATLRHKIAVIEGALALHRPNPDDAFDVLCKVGGFEIGGLAGAMLGAAARRVPVIVDGFISGAAALIACGIAPAVRPYLIAGHRSVERGHLAILEQLDMVPLLDLDLRLGEGTGAALAIGLCAAACRVLDEMATFGEAGVSEKVS